MNYEGGNKKDRQYGSLDQIRPDHLKRYLLAAQAIPWGSRVLDLACGCGYGSWLMHCVGAQVTGVDISSDAIEYAKKHYPGPDYRCQRAEETSGEFDVFVTFETLEHIPNPLGLLRSVNAKFLIASVPNEERNPFNAENFKGESFPHLRHYRPNEFVGLLKEAGYTVDGMCCQVDKAGSITAGTDGLFMIAMCRR